MFEWKNEFSVNIQEIDTQHKKLFEIGSRLYALIRMKNFDVFDDIITVLTELEDYTKYHFNYEEKLMALYGFEDYEAHKMQHSIFVQKLEDVRKIDIDEAQSKVLMDIIVFVADWITNHILKRDHEYMDLFLQKIK